MNKETKQARRATQNQNTQTQNRKKKNFTQRMNHMKDSEKIHDTVNKETPNTGTRRSRKHKPHRHI